MQKFNVTTFDKLPIGAKYRSYSPMVFQKTGTTGLGIVGCMPKGPERTLDLVVQVPDDEPFITSWSQIDDFLKAQEEAQENEQISS